MKTRQFLVLAALLGTILVLQGCMRSQNDVWEDTKSAGRHLQRGLQALSGAPGQSRQINNRGDFECVEDEDYYPDGNFQDCEYQDTSCGNSGYQGNQGNYMPADDFVPLEDQCNDIAMADMICRPPRESPGEPGSTIPGIQAFRDPSTIPQLAGVFRTIYFDYDSSLIKGQQNMQIIHGIADYMRFHPNLYLFIEGHTDERGPQAYNLALGSRRSNTVRNMLVNEGVNPDNVFTNSYGKERPVVLERHEEGWSKNRRAEFKVYAR